MVESRESDLDDGDRIIFTDLSGKEIPGYIHHITAGVARLELDDHSVLDIDVDNFQLKRDTDILIKRAAHNCYCEMQIVLSRGCLCGGV